MYRPPYAGKLHSQPLRSGMNPGRNMTTPSALEVSSTIEPRYLLDGLRGSDGKSCLLGRQDAEAIVQTSDYVTPSDPTADQSPPTM
jgi:hypothetical protein